MKRFQALVTGISGVALIAAFATPTLAAKTVIEEEEMDEVTAAGEPKVAQAHTRTGDAYAKNKQLNVFATHLDGQQRLTALTLNNVFGENQVANATNIQSGNNNSTEGIGGGQDNTILQSWGSGKAHDYAKVRGKRGGNGGDGGTVKKAHGLINKGKAGNGGNGGNASQGVIGILWEFGDEIADASSRTGDAYAKNSVYTIVAGAFHENSQTDLVALTVNNVFGFNQVANGLNISSGAINDSGIVAASTGTASNQSNDIAQFRGSPYKWWKAPTFSNTPPPSGPVTP